MLGDGIQSPAPSSKSPLGVCLKQKVGWATPPHPLPPRSRVLKSPQASLQSVPLFPLVPWVELTEGTSHRALEHTLLNATKGEGWLRQRRV